MEQNITFTAPVFKGTDSQNGIPVKNQEGYWTVGGFVDPTNTQKATFGVAMSYLTTAPNSFFVGFPTGNEVFVGILKWNGMIAQNSPFKPDYILNGLPCSVLAFGAVQNMTTTKTAAGAIDPARGAIVIAKNTTGQIEFLASTANSIPAGWTQLTASVFDVDSTTNNVSLWVGNTFATTALTTPSTSKQLTSFGIVVTGSTGWSALADIVESTGVVSITVPTGTTVTALKAQFTGNYTSIVVGATPQVSGVTANDFTNPVAYVLTDGNSATKTYTVTVTVHS